MVKGLYLRLKRELRAYRFALGDSRTPKRAKWLLRFAFAYLLSPIDLIPDFIPIIGCLDDLVILPGLLFVVHRTIPKQVMTDCRMRAMAESNL